jgi:hypothetical protein
MLESCMNRILMVSPEHKIVPVVIIVTAIVRSVHGIFILPVTAVPPHVPEFGHGGGDNFSWRKGCKNDGLVTNTLRIITYDSESVFAFLYFYYHMLQHLFMEPMVIPSRTCLGYHRVIEEDESNKKADKPVQECARHSKRVLGVLVRCRNHTLHHKAA